MDYWKEIDVTRYDCYNDFHNLHADKRIWYATTKARQTYCDVAFAEGDFIMFGKESAGIPEEILVEHPDQCIRIPMLPDKRSLNLSNSVAIVLYEALRQNGFADLEAEGKLHRLEWK
jgi:tRNA (cytidine/uridine-2'-O-)-methyltransferase